MSNLKANRRAAVPSLGIEPCGRLIICLVITRTRNGIDESIDPSLLPSLLPDSRTRSQDCGSTPNGDWTRAHESAQQHEGVEGSWVHAYLHRKESDQSNAEYCTALIFARCKLGWAIAIGRAPCAT